MSKGKIKIWWSGGYDEFNYGDAITPYLVSKITNKEVVLSPKNISDKVYLVIGSIINRLGTFSNCEVWGAGIIHSLETAKPGVKFHAVRGPLTRERLLKTGHECPEVYGDPALLLPRYYQPKVEKKYEVGLIPHYIDQEYIKNNVSDDVKIIDLTHPNVEKVTDMIFSCKRIVSSSLHGVIVAQAYGIPATLVKFGNRLSGDGIKFSDYFLTVGIKPYKPINMMGVDLTNERLINLVDNSNYGTKIIDFDYDKLLKSCPFK